MTTVSLLTFPVLTVPDVLFPIGERERPMSLTFPVLPVPDVRSTIGERERPMSLTFPVLKVADVRFPIGPRVRPMTLTYPVLPFADVRSTIGPRERPMTLTFPVLPFADVRSTIGPRVRPMPLTFPVLPFAVVYAYPFAVVYTKINVVHLRFSLSNGRKIRKHPLKLLEREATHTNPLQFCALCDQIGQANVGDRAPTDVQSLEVRVVRRNGLDDIVIDGSTAVQQYRCQIGEFLAVEASEQIVFSETTLVLVRLFPPNGPKTVGTIALVQIILVCTTPVPNGGTSSGCGVAGCFAKLSRQQ